MSVAEFQANRIFTRLPKSVSLGDLLSAGAVGLIDAVEKFDLGRGVKFETYASQRVAGAILDWLREIDWVPRLERQRDRPVVEMKSINEKRYEHGEHAVEAVHLIPDPGAEAAAVQAGEIDSFELLIARLDPDARLILRLYYREDLQMREIGKAMGISESRVSQLHSSAIARLKALTPRRQGAA